MTHKRKKLLVHRQIQRALMRRAAFYFFTCMLFILLPASLLRTAQQPERLLTEHVVNVLQDYAPIFKRLGVTTVVKFQALSSVIPAKSLPNRSTMAVVEIRIA